MEHLPPAPGGDDHVGPVGTQGGAAAATVLHLARHWGSWGLGLRLTSLLRPAGPQRVLASRATAWVDALHGTQHRPVQVQGHGVEPVVAPGFSRSVHTVMGWMPVARMAAMFWALAPPQ